MCSRDSKTGFNLMKWGFALRDRFRPPETILREAPLEPGMVILDFGCGPGAFSEAAGETVGPGGKVVAADRQEAALRAVEKRFRRRGWTHIVTIRTEADTGLGSGSVDGVLLYDVYHGLDEPNRILAELHRVLRPGGFLSFSDHHLDREQTELEITATGLFRLDRQGERTLLFRKAPVS